MSAAVFQRESKSNGTKQPHEPPLATASMPHKGSSNYKGFVAGVFSGIAKVMVGHPFDTIKVRCQTQTASAAQFRGPLHVLRDTIRNEGVAALYKGASPPVVGWMLMDSVMLGSLTFYRRMLLENVFHPAVLSGSPAGLQKVLPTAGERLHQLPTVGHAIAGIMAGWTVSFIATPVELVKARLQIQYAMNKKDRQYQGPIDCIKKMHASHGLASLYHGLSATLIFRSFFVFWWGSYDVLSRVFSERTNLSTPAINFWAGGLSAQVFWLTSFPSDVVKQRIMTDHLDERRKFFRWTDAAKSIWRENGWRGYWRGFLPCFLRAFPANATALAAFEGVMRALPS